MNEVLPQVEKVAPELVRELQAKLGRNLLRFQVIEHTLKGLLPFVHSDGQAKGDAEYLELKAMLRDKPMGYLKQYLSEAVKVDSENFGSYVDEVIKSRNTLIHHFLDVEGVALATNEGHRKGIAFLDQQFKFAETLYQVSFAMAVGVEHALTRTDSLEGTLPS